jgi:hypothetical protein
VPSKLSPIWSATFVEGLAIRDYVFTARHVLVASFTSCGAGMQLFYLTRKILTEL